MIKDTDSHLGTLTAQSAQMREESKDTALAQAFAEAERKLQAATQREQYIQAEEKKVTDLVPPGTTRDQLLDRIREMRNVKVEESHDYYITPEQQAQIDLEQQAGREAVARAEAEQQRIAALQAKTVAVAEAARMTPVHHPNPSQDEQYPAIKSTLGKPSTPPSAPKQLK